IQHIVLQCFRRQNRNLVTEACEFDSELSVVERSDLDPLIGLRTGVFESWPRFPACACRESYGGVRTRHDSHTCDLTLAESTKLILDRIQIGQRCIAYLRPIFLHR